MEPSTMGQGSRENGRSRAAPAEPFVRRARLRNYKSLATCDIALDKLTILVGRNGSGKSNFLDALRFVADALQTTLDQALRSRGGINEVRRRGTGRPRNVSIDLELALDRGRIARYSFELSAREKGGFRVREEHLLIEDTNGVRVASYHVVEGKLASDHGQAMPPVAPDRLYLVAASGLPEFRPVYDSLCMMGFYSLNPEAIRALQIPDAGEILHRDGGNIASVIARIGREQPHALASIEQYLEAIAPGVVGVGHVSLGPKETLEFRQRVSGSRSPWRFHASSMSDGTLLALGTLVAVGQLGEHGAPMKLVGIEEPETALHPAAAGALMDALREAAEQTQIVLTTHSPDLLDQARIDADCILVVRARDSDTQIGGIDPASRSVIADHLYSAGELLEMDQLEPNPRDLDRQRQLQLFDHDGAVE